MAVNFTLSTFPYTGQFTSDWQTGAIQQYAYTLSLSPGNHELSVLPDLAVITTAANASAVTTDDINWYAEEAQLSGAYVSRRVEYYNSTGQLSVNDVAVGNLMWQADTLAEQAMTNAGIPAHYGAFQFMGGTIAIEAARTESRNAYSGDLTRYVYTAEYTLHVSGWNYSYARLPESTLTPMSGRFLITQGNPTGQRTSTWGGDWLNVLSIYDNYVPPVVTPPVTSLDPFNLPSTLNFTPTGTQSGVETLPIVNTAETAWWAGTGTTIMQGYVSTALSALQQLADGYSMPNVGAMLGVVNAATTAEGVREWLYAQVAKLWAHDAEGMTLAVMAGASPNPNAYGAQINSWMGKGRQLNEDTEQGARDNAISIVADTALPGGGTMWSVFRGIPYGASETNSFTLALHLPNTSLQGGERSDVIAGGSGADTINLGGGADFAEGFIGNDVLNGEAGSDWLCGGAGDDTLDGGTGVDAAVLAGLRQNYTLAATSDGFTLADNQGSEGRDTLRQVERVHFSDLKLAFDLGRDEHAGQALEFIGLLDPSLATNASITGLILSYFDEGISLQALCQRAIDIGLVSRYAGSNSNTDLVRMAYRNIVGSEADAAAQDMLLGFMDGRSASLSQADFMSMVAGLELNRVHVGLVGMQQTGMSFL